MQKPVPQIVEFREKLSKLSREEILGIIDDQHPETPTDIGWKKEILRKEWVFRNKLSHISDNYGDPIVEGDYTHEELIRLVDPPFVFSKELMKKGFTEIMQRQIHIASDPVLWAQQILGVTPRSYQALVMRDDHENVVLRFGRRLGKTYLLVMYMLWYAYVFPRARILVLAPAKTQVALVYEAILEIADGSPILMDAITRKVKSPQHEVWLTNGATIKLFTTGLKNGSRSDGARGQEADMIVLDEMDYMGSDDLVALMAMLQNTDSSKTFSKKLIGASTPTGQRSTYWRWNVDPAENFNAYFSPSYVNPGWNSEEEVKARIRYKNEQHYRHEIEADWGEDADGVYGRKYIDQSFNILPEWDYNSIKLDHDKFLYTLGVDWDKHGAGVNIVAVEAPRGDPYRGPVKVIYRDEVRKGDFTYLESIDEIVKLHSRFNFDHLYVDQGSGEVQAELLHKYGLDNPQTQMHTRAKAWHFSNTIEVRDPYTRQIEKKRLKPYMVDNLSHYLEQGKIIFNSGDDELFLQLISYIKIRESESGHPVFAAGGEAVDHAHDALLLALFAITHNYDSMFDNYVSASPQAISNTFFMPGKSETSKKTEGVVNDDYVDWDLTSSSKKTKSKEDGSHSSIPRRTSFNNSRPNSSRAAVKRKTF
jgi:hypothetical protein